MKKLIMFVMVLAIATPAVALKYPDVAPDFTGCDNSAWVIWEFLEDGCMPTSTEADPAYEYNPEPVEGVTFGSRHWDDPTEDAGWGGSYGADPWTYANDAYTILAEDSFNQSIPLRGEHQYLRQYFQVVHTLVDGLEEDDYRWPIGLGLELWDMSVYEENGWTGCPTGYENLSGDGYIGGAENVPPQQMIDQGNGWYTSIWVNDFDNDGSLTTENPTELDLDLATHTACIIGMDFDVPAESFQVEEVILDFIWFNEADGSDIPTVPCKVRGGKPPLDIVSVVVYEPHDDGGPPAQGPVSDPLQVKLKYKPGEDLGYPNFNCYVMVDPDPNQENAGSSDFSFTNPVPPDPNGNVYLTFTQANWDTYQNITVTATEDTEREGDESFNIEFTVTIDIADPNFGNPEPVIQRKSAVSVVDNDIPFISVVPYGNLMDVLTENDPCVPRCVNVTLSHLPNSDVYVYVTRESEFELLLESMSVMDPPLGIADEPNRLEFTSGTYNSPQQICLEARDDDDRPDTDLEWIPGVILFNGISDDIRYQSSEDGGELEDKSVDFNVQDNECGARGYSYADFNEDCVVDLADFAHFYSQWTLCTQPYPSDPCEVCDKLWNLEEEE